MKIFRNTNPLRLVIQVLVLLIIILLAVTFYTGLKSGADFEAYCPFGGMLALMSFISSETLACSMTSVQIALGVTLALGLFVFSKLFCSFFCPVGSVSEFLGSAGRKFRLNITPEGYPDKILRSGKYILLVLTVSYTVTSSELFCRKFDPYFASASGFNSDVEMFWGIATLIVVIAGSFFLRLSWCRYFCPLGAISNIFRHIIISGSIIVLYTILHFAGLHINYLWPLILASALTWMSEAGLILPQGKPVFRVRRDTSICTGCRICSVKCPQAIDVAKIEDVDHADCNMCGDCIHVCPEKGALTVNRRFGKNLPVIAALLLLAAGLVAGKFFELPTLSQYWGPADLKDKMELFSKSGLKNVKCFGSSNSFAGQLKNIKGVTGVTAWAGSHRADILYDPSVTDTIEILRSVFNPVKVKIRNSSQDAIGIREYILGVENFFDPTDAVYLRQILETDSAVIGFTTEFGCPVVIKVYTEETEGQKVTFSGKTIEDQKGRMELKGNDGKPVVTSYRIKSEFVSDTLLTSDEYNKRLYTGFSASYRYISGKSRSLYRVTFPGGGTNSSNAMLEPLSQFLSSQPMIEGIESRWEGNEPILDIVYDSSIAGDSAIHELINSQFLIITDRKGQKQRRENQLRFPFRGKVLEAPSKE